MSEEGVETFQVSPQEEPQRRQAVAEKRFLHVTVVDHNPVIEGTDEVSYVDVRIPLGMLIVQMVNMGAEGDLVRMNEEKKTIHIRVE